MASNKPLDILTGWLLLLAMTSCAPAGSLVEIGSIGPVQEVFNYQHDRCVVWDAPDTPARAIRTSTGEIRLFAANDANRPLVGPDFDHLSKSCFVPFIGSANPHPEGFDGQAWLSAFYTEDGLTVHALVHNEVHVADSTCKPDRSAACWRNTITYAVSKDGGHSFRQPLPPDNVVAALPYRFDHVADRPNRPTGYFNPTNIVRFRGMFYALFLAEPEAAQRHGACLIRTANLADPKSWRGWDGADFTIRFVDPYREQALIPDQHVCTPVGIGSLDFAMHSLVFHQPSGQFFALMANRRPATPDRPQGIYLARSSDLINWSEPSLLLAASTSEKQPGGCASALFLEANLIDHASIDRSFSVIGNEAWLYLNRYNLHDCRITDDRDLVRRQITFNSR